MLKLKASVRSESMVSTPTSKGVWNRRAVKLLSDDLPDQFLQVDLDESHPPVGVGKSVELRITGVRDVYEGVIRIQVEPGSLMPAAQSK